MKAASGCGSVRGAAGLWRIDGVAVVLREQSGGECE